MATKQTKQFNVIFRNDKKVTLPFHCKDLPKGTILSILKSAGITKNDIKKYL